jgi:hypothetical protein
MRRRRKHTFSTIEGLYFLLGPCKVVIKKRKVKKTQIAFRNASLPVHELGSIGIELSRVFRIWKLQNNGKKGIRR